MNYNNLEKIDWINAFKDKYGHPPRVLHIGNIANNAYNNVKLLNDAGLDCDVICYEYYHIMGCPEWEDADFEGNINDQFVPAWRSIDLKGFERPRWFAQGPLEWCIKYLLARRSGNTRKQNLYWKLLGHANKTTRPITIGYLYYFFLILWRSLESLAYLAYKNKGDIIVGLKKRLKFLYRGNYLFGDLATALAYVVLFPIILIFKFLRIIHFFTKGCFLDGRMNYLEATFLSVFPNRPDRLTKEDFISATNGRIMTLWQELFEKYDIVHAYATDGIYPLLAGAKYIAYEHGTIRNIPFQNSAQGRLCALTYKLADRVCITNADNIVAAKRLKLDNYDFIPHPINEELANIDEKSRQLYMELHGRLKSDFIVFHPARQHWGKERHPDWEKGNDIFIRGFARFVHEYNPIAAAIFVEWGKFTPESKELLRELDIEGRVNWIQPQPNRSMLRYIYATDLIADQFYLGAFGTILPKALLCGKPSMIYLDKNIHEWCFPEMPPVINTKTEQDVFKGLVKSYSDRERAVQLSRDSKAWYNKYHSNKIILDRLIRAYRLALSVNI